MIKFTIRLCLFVALLFSTSNAWSQGMAVNTSGSAADNSAMLDVSSTSRGVLVPRMTAAQKTAISSPATGLLIYQTDGTAGFYYYNGTAWTAISGSGSAGGDLTGTYPNPSIATGAVTTSKIADNTVTVNKISATGTKSSSTYLSGDGTWSTPSGGGSGSSSTALDLSVTMSGAQSVPAASTADIQFDNLITAPAIGAFNTSTYAYTVGATGDYLIQFSILTSTANVLVYPQLTLNAAVAEYGIAVLNNNFAPYPGRGSLSVVRHLAANDVIKVQLVNTNGTTAATVPLGMSKFSVIKL